MSMKYEHSSLVENTGIFRGRVSTTLPLGCMMLYLAELLWMFTHILPSCRILQNEYFSDPTPQYRQVLMTILHMIFS